MSTYLFHHLYSITILTALNTFCICQCLCLSVVVDSCQDTWVIITTAALNKLATDATYFACSHSIISYCFHWHSFNSWLSIDFSIVWCFVMIKMSCFASCRCSLYGRFLFVVALCQCMCQERKRWVVTLLSQKTFLLLYSFIRNTCRKMWPRNVENKVCRHMSIQSWHF
jgi:hypothetical protein